jgi:hypothetical protein
MKRLINIIEQDAAIWELSKEEVEYILSKGIHNKVCELETYALSENNMIDAWVESFREIIKTLDAVIIPYIGIDRTANFIWMKENPKSWVTGV